MRGWTLRRAVVAGLACALVVLAVGLALRWADWTNRVPMVQSAFPMLGCAVAVILLFALLLRAWRLSAAAFVVALVPGMLAVQSFQSETVAPSSSDDVVMVANLEFGQADSAAVVDAVRRRHVTTLILVEITPDAERRLRAAGLEALLPHAVSDVVPGYQGRQVRSVHPLTALPAIRTGSDFRDPVVDVASPRGTYRLRVVHPLAPMPDIVGKWRAQLRDIATWRAAQPQKIPLVIAGDFNASTAHPAFRGLAEGMTDAHRAAGTGWVRTWPTGRRTPAFVQLDHVLVRRLDVVSAGVDTIPGTDHASAWARVRVTGAATQG